METRGKKPSDTLEQIVQDAIEREKIINEQHPERHGYGMIQGEADDLIRRIEHLNNNQLKAQQAKVKNREDRIRVVGNDRLYTHSPEDIIIDKLDREQISRAETFVLSRLSKRSVNFYLLKSDGMKFTDIGKLYNVHRSTVSRDIKKTNEMLKEEFIAIKNGGENHVFI